MIYPLLKKRIQRESYSNKEDMQQMLDTYYFVGRITDEQYKLRMIKLEESNCAHMLRNGMIDQEQYDSMMDSFEQQYGIEEKHKVK